jgi:hypothetical protein
VLDGIAVYLGNETATNVSVWCGNTSLAVGGLCEVQLFTPRLNLVRGPGRRAAAGQCSLTVR